MSSPGCHLFSLVPEFPSPAPDRGDQRREPRAPVPLPSYGQLYVRKQGGVGRGLLGVTGAWDACDCYSHPASRPTAAHYACPPALVLATWESKAIHQPMAPPPGLPAPVQILSRAQGCKVSLLTHLQGNSPCSFGRGLSSRWVLPAAGVWPRLPSATQLSSGSFWGHPGKEAVT